MDLTQIVILLLNNELSSFTENMAEHFIRNMVLYQVTVYKTFIA